MNPQTITALKVQPGHRERILVFLDGEQAFSIGLMAAAQLQRGQELDQTEVERLRREGEIDLAYSQALRLIGFRPRSRAEVSRHLHEKGHDDEVVDAVTERLLVAGYLDDVAFVRFWVENRERFRPRSVQALRYELRQKGIENRIMDEVLSGLDEEESAWAAVEGRLARWQALGKDEFQAKVMGFLSRRGFSYETVHRVCERALSTKGHT